MLNAGLGDEAEENEAGEGEEEAGGVGSLSAISVCELADYWSIECQIMNARSRRPTRAERKLELLLYLPLRPPR